MQDTKSEQKKQQNFNESTQCAWTQDDPSRFRAFRSGSIPFISRIIQEYYNIFVRNFKQRKKDKCNLIINPNNIQCRFKNIISSIIIPR
ncbi:hypothetical protein HMPREF1514_0714 [Streptococcus sp. AS20]|nr:hypothetical protein HMPREF1514_0714 [Streptococcus sp. AS20]